VVSTLVEADPSDRTARITITHQATRYTPRSARIGHCGSRAAGLVDGVSHGRALPLSPDLAAVPSRLLQVPFGDDRAGPGAVIVPGEKLKLRGFRVAAPHLPV